MPCVQLSSGEEELADLLAGPSVAELEEARSLVADPLVLLSDEPTGALDTASGRDLMNLLTELVDREGLTIVLVTHE